MGAQAPAIVNLFIHPPRLSSSRCASECLCLCWRRRTAPPRPPAFLRRPDVAHASLSSAAGTGSSRHSPGPSAPRLHSPTAARMSRSVG
eukprot:2826545-Rhodomonas_salina.2